MMDTRLRPTVLLLIVALLGWLPVGCSVTGSVQASEEYREVFEVGDDSEVIVDTFNGRITVQATTNDGKVEARVVARGSGTSQEAAESDLAKVEVGMAREGDRITITARRTDRPLALNNSGADVEIALPSDASLQLRTSNGRVEAANVTGSILARTSNGAITTRGGTDVDLDSSNGPISVNNATGRLKLRTSNGAIDILSARGVSVSAQTSNATLTFSGALLPGEHSFQTSNGDLALTLPGDATFTIDAQTSNGSVRTEFVDGLEVTDTSISGAVGRLPLVAITARTSNGDLAVMMMKP